MNIWLLSGLLLGLSTGTMGAPALAQTAQSEIDAHIAAARAAAGRDYLPTFANLCFSGLGHGGGGCGGVGRGAAGRGGGAAATPDPAGWYASPYRVFDNLYWLGTRQHSSGWSSKRKTPSDGCATWIR